MNIYLDVSCLSRPFDDQSQRRIRLESEATALILEQCEQGEWKHVASEMAKIEIDAISDRQKRVRVQLMLPKSRSIFRLTEEVYSRAEELQMLGFKSADAVHVAAAEAMDAEVFLTCDDRLLRVAKRQRDRLRVAVDNPVDWLKGYGHADLG